MGYRLNNVCFSYKKKKVFENFSINFKKGIFHGILGTNGCGKTTLLDLLINYKQAQKGDVLLNEKTIQSYSRRMLSQKTALIPQEYNIHFPFSVKDVVAMGRYPYLPKFAKPAQSDFAIIEQIMKKTKIWELKDKIITKLSSGEKQRVVFARALVQDAQNFLLDEATSNLDVEHSLVLLEVIKQKVGQLKKTVIAVFHDINLAALFCDEIIFMVNGKIYAQGKVNDVLTQENINLVFHINADIQQNKETKDINVLFKRKK